MNLSEIGNAVFILDPKDLDLFVVDQTEGEICYEFLGEKKWIWSKSPQTERIYIHVMNGEMSIGKFKLFEYGLIRERNLIDFYNEKGWKTPKERDTMFSNYKISSIKFGEINDVALESAIEKIAHQLKDVEIKTKGDKTYLISNGTAIELKGEEFAAKVEDYLTGKTVASLSSNKVMLTLISNLGIISEVTLASQADDLSSIFG